MQAYGCSLNPPQIKLQRFQAIQANCPLYLENSICWKLSSKLKIQFLDRLQTCYINLIFQQTAACSSLKFNNPNLTFNYKQAER